MHEKGGFTRRGIAELSRRNVFRVAAAYAVTAWLLLQLGDILLGNFGAPEWVFRSVVALLVIGFPVVLVFSWAYEITPEGIKRERDVARDASIAPRTGRRLDQITILMVVLAAGVLAADRLWLRPPAQAAMSAARQPGAADNSIAVLPFVNMSPDPDQEYFADGLTEEILNLLAQIRELRVIGRTSSFAFKGRSEDLRSIGAALDVGYLIEGSVRKAGDQLRITAQLIQVHDGSHLWSRTYDRRLENIFAIQTEIAAAIAEALQLSLVGSAQQAPVAQPAASLSAYERYLQARRLLQARTTEGITAARALLDEALALDPEYAAALAAAGLARLLLADSPGTYGDVPIAEAWAGAGPLIERALEVDPLLAEAHAARGLMFYQQQDLERAESTLARAVELNPSLSDALNWRVSVVQETGRLREALELRRRLAQVDPLHVANLTNLVYTLIEAGDVRQAVDMAVRIQRGFPDSPMGHMSHADVLRSAGRLHEALEVVRRAGDLDPGAAIVVWSRTEVLFALGAFEDVLEIPDSHLRGHALLALGRTDEAIAEAEAQAAAGRWSADLRLMRILALAGRHEQALSQYERRWNGLEAFEARSGASGLALLSAVQRAEGRDAESAATLARLGERLGFMREQGHGGPGFRYMEAEYRVLSGDHRGGLAVLAEAIDQGFRIPWLAREPTFAELRGQPPFEAQVDRMKVLIDAERANLGWGPMRSLR